MANGANFQSDSYVVWNSEPLATTYVSSTELQAQVPAVDLAKPDTAEVSVVTPAPGTEESGVIVFTIQPTPPAASGGTNLSAVDIQANDMVWDPNSQQIYISVPSSNGANGNAVTALNPVNGQLGISRDAGSEPDMIALAKDSSYLYVGIDGSGSVQRFTMPNLGTDVNVPLGTDPILGKPYYAMDVETAPGSPHTIAVVRGILNDSPAEEGGVVIYDDATPRPTFVPGFAQSGNPIGSIQWGSDATHIYAENDESSGFNLDVLAVSASGVQIAETYPGLFSVFGAKLHYDAATGYLYSDGGQVVDPSTGALLGSFALSSIMLSNDVIVMVPDGNLGIAYFLGQTPAQKDTPDYTIEAFDLARFTPINSIAISNVAGTPVKLIRWGSNGLAFLTKDIINTPGGNIFIEGSGVYLISGAFVTNPAMQGRRTAPATQ